MRRPRKAGQGGKGEKPQRGRGRKAVKQGMTTGNDAQIRTAFWGSSVRAVSFFKGVPAGADPGTQKLMHSEARAEPSPAPRPLEAWFMECRVRGSTAILGARSTCTRARPPWLLFCLSHKSGAGLVWGRVDGQGVGGGHFERLLLSTVLGPHDDTLTGMMAIFSPGAAPAPVHTYHTAAERGRGWCLG